MRLVECNKCGKVFEVEGEWGYCPFCEHDDVEVFKNQLLNVQMVSSKEITKLHKELALTEKALALAVETMRYELGRCAIKNLYKKAIENLKDNLNMKFDTEMCDWYIEQAKEMMKSE